MKKLYILFFCIPFFTIAQLSNPGFEAVSDSNPSLPAHWKARILPKYAWELDSKNPHTGNNSLLISNHSSLDSTLFSSFSQICDLKAGSVKKICLTAFIKTEQVSKNAGLWCQLWDSTKKQVRFYSLQTQNQIIRGTTGWAKYSVTLFITPDIKHLLLGGFLKGTGKVWYDDIAIEDLTTRNFKPTSKIVEKYLKQTIKIAKKESLYKDSIDWLSTETDMKELSKGAQTTNECYPAMDYLISVLRKKGDNHSQFYPPIKNIKNKIENLDGRQPSGKYLGNSIAYIEVPGFVSINEKIGKAFATKIQSIIKDLDSSQNVTNWIVDLRENTGGNMYPMIAGLGPIIGEGTLGYFNHINTKKPHAWKYIDGNAILGQSVLCKVDKPYRLKNKNINIIVLIGPNTASSGEMTTISFLGKSNVILIGQASGGYSTGNKSHELLDGSILNLCSSNCSDRNKNKIIGKIQPHEEIEFDFSNNVDSAIEYAKNKFLKMK